MNKPEQHIYVDGGLGKGVGVVISEEYYSEGQRHMFAMYIWIYPVYI
jgi:hypothetical protein